MARAFPDVPDQPARVYFAITLASVMLPFHVLVIPQYIFFSQFGLVNTYWPLLIPCGPRW